MFSHSILVILGVQTVTVFPYHSSHA